MRTHPSLFPSFLNPSLREPGHAGPKVRRFRQPGRDGALPGFERDRQFQTVLHSVARRTRKEKTISLAPQMMTRRSTLAEKRLQLQQTTRSPSDWQKDQ